MIGAGGVNESFYQTAETIDFAVSSTPFLMYFPNPQPYHKFAMLKSLVRSDVLSRAAGLSRKAR